MIIHYTDPGMIPIKAFCFGLLIINISICIAADFENGVSAFERGEFTTARKIMSTVKTNPLAVQSYILAMSDVIERSNVVPNLLKHIEEHQNRSDVSESDDPFYQTLFGRLHLSGVLEDAKPKKGLKLIQKHAHSYGYAAYLLGQYYEGSFLVNSKPALDHAQKEYEQAVTLHFNLAAERLKEISLKFSSSVAKTNDIQNKQARQRLLYDGGCCKGACTSHTSQPNAYPITQKGHDAEIDKYQLFRSSFLSGAAYSLLPEIFRDILDSKGYFQTSDIVATIIQGGIIVYNTSSYVPTITGMSVRYGLNQLGFSRQASTVAGSTTAIAASLSQKLIFSQESVFDCVIDCALGVSGSYTGSTLALKTKSWVYELWREKTLKSLCYVVMAGVSMSMIVFYDLSIYSLFVSIPEECCHT